MESARSSGISRQSLPARTTRAILPRRPQPPTRLPPILMAPTITVGVMTDDGIGAKFRNIAAIAASQNNPSNPTPPSATTDAIASDLNGADNHRRRDDRRWNRREVQEYRGNRCQPEQPEQSYPAVRNHRRDCLRS